MKNVRLGRTEIIVPQNAFGCLPIQRDSKEVAVKLLREAYEGGMRFFDTARAYTDSEEKVGEAFDGIRDKIYIATKTAAKTPEGFWKDLETSLKNLRTDYIDIYQLHMVPQCYRPGDGTGMYECLEQAKEKGLIRHIGITTHKLAVAQEIIESGLYETLQYPFSYLSSESGKGYGLYLHEGAGRRPGHPLRRSHGLYDAVRQSCSDLGDTARERAAGVALLHGEHALHD